MWRAKFQICARVRAPTAARRGRCHARHLLTVWSVLHLRSPRGSTRGWEEPLPCAFASSPDGAGSYVCGFEEAQPSAGPSWVSIGRPGSFPGSFGQHSLMFSESCSAGIYVIIHSCEKTPELRQAICMPTVQAVFPPSQARWYCVKMRCRTSARGQYIPHLITFLRKSWSICQLTRVQMHLPELLFHTAGDIGNMLFPARIGSNRLQQTPDVVLCSRCLGPLYIHPSWQQPGQFLYSTHFR